MTIEQQLKQVRKELKEIKNLLKPEPVKKQTPDYKTKILKKYIKS